MGGGSLKVDCVTLDEAFQTDKPTIIKMDIEGSEAQALFGAGRLLNQHQPILSICAYHRQSDLWRLPLLIHSLNPDYRILLRPHIQLVEDLVCYAVSAGAYAFLPRGHQERA
jgi:hypothetical protein